MTVVDLLQIQLAKESVWGTGVTATSKLTGITNAGIQPVVNTKLFKERRASLAPAFNAAVTGQSGTGFVEGYATYEDICYYLDALIAEATPGGSPGYVRTYDWANTNTPRLNTLYLGTTGYVQRLLGALANQLNISGASGESDTEWKFRCDYLGKAVDGGSTLAALSDRAVTPASVSQTQLYIDTWGGTIGSTLIDTTAFSFELALNANRIMKHYLANASLLAGGHEKAGADPGGNTLKLSLELNATSKAFVDAMIAPGLFQKQVRIKATSGTLIIQIDFAGTAVVTPDSYVDKGGILSMDLTLQGTYNPTLAGWFKASVTSYVATLP